MEAGTLTGARFFAFGAWALRIPDALWAQMEPVQEECACPVRTVVPEVTGTTATMREYDVILRRLTGHQSGVVSEVQAKAAFLEAIGNVRARGVPVSEDVWVAHQLGWQ